MLHLFSDALQDLGISWRQIRRRPSWALATVGVLALGLGANAAMFSAFETWILRPLPFPDPEQLATVWETRPVEGRLQIAVSPANLDDWQRLQTSFSALGAFQRAHFNVDDEAEPVRVEGCRISASLFPLLGVEPAVGRGFGAAEDLPGRPAAVTLLSQRLWRERYDSDPAVLGRLIRLDGEVHEIVGVMPDGFAFPEWAEVWTPLGADPVGLSRDTRYLAVMGRLREGVSHERAEAELQRIAVDLATLHPETNRGFSVRLEPPKDTWVPDVVRVALTSSLAAAVLVLLIICATVAGLLLAQTSARSRELAVRTALGAGRGRLVRQLVTETTLLALVGGVLGSLLGIAWLDLMLARVPVDPPYLFRMQVDAGALLWTLGASLLAGVACSVAPLLYASRLSVEQALRTGGRGGASTSGARLRSALVVTEIALSTALAIGAFLMVKSFYVQQRVDHGFRTEGVVTMELSLRGGGLETAAQRLSFTERLREDLRPVSTAAGLASHLPVADGYLASLEAEGQPVERGQGRRAAEVSVTEGYLEALEVPVVGGRLFTATEHRHGSEVVLVSARLARELWGTTDVVGRRLRNGLGGEEPWLRVVGVVGDVDAGRDMVQPDSANWLQLYRPYASSPVRQLTLVAQSDRPTEELAIALRQAVRRAGAAVPTAEVLSMRQAIHRQRWVTRFFSEELALYAGIALVIATLGLYGLVAESVARRQHEMAIRLAVGADRAGVLGLVVGHGARLAAIGVALGLLLGLPAARAAASMLGGVSPADPFILGGVVLVLASASLLASYLPARRAAAVDPAQSLRAE